MGEAAASPSSRRESHVESGGDKILTAGPRAWECARNNLVGELRNLVRARDIALAEQRARLVKESIVLREQRHTLALSNSGFSCKIAKLFGWTDVVDCHTSKSPLSASPTQSRSSSPVTTYPNDFNDWMERRATRAPQTSVGKHEEVVEGVAEGTLGEKIRGGHMKSSPDIGELGDRPDGSNKEDQENLSGACGTAVSVPLTIHPNNIIEGTIACSQCAKLRGELEVVLTDRTLAEAELVSLRRAISQADPALWELEPAGSANTRHASEGEALVKIHAPESENNGVDTSFRTTGNDLDLQHELERLERFIPVRGESSVSYFAEKDRGAVDIAVLQDSIVQPEDGANGGEPANLAATLSATVARRACYFEEQSRRRLLRLGVETDLQAARVKLDRLLSTTTGSAEKMPVNPSQGRGSQTLGSKEDRRMFQDCLTDGKTRRKETGTCSEKGHRKRVNFADNGCSVSKKEEVPSSTAGRQMGQGRGIGSQQPKRRLEKRRGNSATSGRSPDVSNSSPHERRSPTPEEVTTARICPPSQMDHGTVSAPMDDPESTTKLGNKNRDIASDASGKTTGESAEVQNPKKREETPKPFSGSAMRCENTIEDDEDVKTTSSCLVERDLSDRREASKNPVTADDIQPCQGPNTVEGWGEVHREDLPVQDSDSAGARVANQSGTKESGTASLPKQGTGKVSRKTAVAKGMVKTKSSSPTRCAPGRSPSTSPLRANAPPAAAQVHTQRADRAEDRGDPGRCTSSKSLGEQSQHASDVAHGCQPRETPHSVLNDHSEGSVDSRRRKFEANNTEAGERAVSESENVSAESALGAEGSKAAGRGKYGTKYVSKKNGLAQITTKAIRRQVSGGSSPEKSTRTATVPTSISRLPVQTSKGNAGIKASEKAPTRLGITSRHNRASGRNRSGDSTDSISETSRKDPHADTRGSGEAQRREKTEAQPSIGEDAELGSASIKIKDEAIEEGGAEVDSTTRSSVNNKETENPPRISESIRQGSRKEAKDELVSAGAQHDKAPGNVSGERDSEIGVIGTRDNGTHACDSFAASQASVNDQNGTNEQSLPEGFSELSESLVMEVNKLRLEKAELEDTVAQLNVAAAQLYFVEYEQMKEKCRQLKRVVLGPSSRPTEEESAYCHSCQEIMHRLKLIGLTFFRKRIGGVMGEKFFPDGLARALTLIRRSQVAQGCQTAPVERLGPLGYGGSPLSRTRDVHVQVAGGIDAEDEPLMEQQVYALLGKLDLVLKRREDDLQAYHREAEEGAREARALLASAAAQHNPCNAWGLTCPPNVQQLVDGREGPAGAPRPAINPTNLLFSAAVVLDSVVEAGAVPRKDHFKTSKSSDNGKQSGDPTGFKREDACCGESRRGRFSSAEKALMELANEVVTALESEQRRSDAFAERRRFVAKNHNNSTYSDNGGANFLGRPPVGVPPLIWAMEIHLVEKLMRAFRTVVEARGFEREVEDANLVAAVSLGRSPPYSTDDGAQRNEAPPWHLEHRLLSVFRGEKEENETGQRARNDFETSCSTVNTKPEQHQMYEGVIPYSPRNGKSRPKNDVVRVDPRHMNASPTTSPRRSDGLTRGEPPGRHAPKIRTGLTSNYHGSSPISPAGRSPRTAYQSKPTHQVDCSINAGAQRKLQSHHHQQQRSEQQPHGVDAVSHVEAAVFTVRPSRLHPRPCSASFEGRHCRVEGEGHNTPPAITERFHPRPQSARLAEHGNDSGDCRLAYNGVPSDNQDIDGRREYHKAETLETNITIGNQQLQQQQQQPNRPFTTSTTKPSNAAIRRPASAGGRVVDTRIWSSSTTVTQPSTSAFRSRPNQGLRGASVRFKSATTNIGSASESSSLLVPTHSGEVPVFLRRKERELIDLHREKQAAVSGRFELVAHDSDENGNAVDKGVGGPELGDYQVDGETRNERYGGKKESRATEENSLGGDIDSKMLSSVRFEDSMDGAGLLPDAGQQAFFDAWKPVGYDIDLSRYD